MYDPDQLQEFGFQQADVGHEVLEAAQEHEALERLDGAGQRTKRSVRS